MGWETSQRRNTLPADWPAIRRRILRRDGYECQWRDGLGLCGERATDVDHVDRFGGDNDDNLQSLCRRHHSAKSSREGAQAANQKRKEIANRFRRPSSGENRPDVLGP